MLNYKHISRNINIRNQADTTTKKAERNLRPITSAYLQGEYFKCSEIISGEKKV